jgi:hypothetical protein
MLLNPEHGAKVLSTELSPAAMAVAFFLQEYFALKSLHASTNGRRLKSSAALCGTQKCTVSAPVLSTAWSANVEMTELDPNRFISTLEGDRTEMPVESPNMEFQNLAEFVA